MGTDLVLSPLHAKSGAIWGSAWRDFMGVNEEGTGSVREYSGTSADYKRAFYDAWVRRCVNVRGDAISQAPLRVYTPSKGGKRGRQSIDHDALAVLEETNPMAWVAGQNLLRSTLGSLDLYGHFSWQMAFSYSKIPTEVYFMPPGMYEPIENKKTGFFDGVKIRVNEQDKIIPPEVLVYDATMSIDSPVKGSSRIDAGRMDLNLRTYGMASNLWFLRNNMRPDWVLTGDFAPTQENTDKLRRLINQWAGGDNRRGPLILGGGNMHAQLLTMQHKDAEWVMQQRLSQETLAALFGVPMPMMNVLENATLANVDAYKLQFWHDTMTPELKNLARSLTRNFLYRWPDAEKNKLKFGFDLSEVEGLGEDLNHLFEREFTAAKLYTEGMRDGGLTPNQWRLLMYDIHERLGLAPDPFEGVVPQGEDRLVNWNLIPSQQAGMTAVIDAMAARGPNAGIIQNVPSLDVDFEGAAQEMLDDQTARAQQEAATGVPAKSDEHAFVPRHDATKPSEAPPASKKASVPTPHPVPIRDVRLAPIQQKTVRKLKKYFQGLQTQALRELRKRQPEAPKPTKRTALGLQIVPPDAGIGRKDAPTGDFWNQIQSAEDLMAILDEAIAASSEAAFAAAVQEFGLKVAWNVSNPWLPAYVGQRTNLIKNIDQTTLDSLLGSLQAGYDAGEGMPDLSKRVADVFTDAIGNRSDVIARTETIQAYGAASIQAYQEAGLEKAQLYDGANADEADCIDVNGMVVTLDEASQLMAEEHPNGTRAVAPYVELPESVQTPEMATAAAAPLPPPKSDLVQVAEMFAMAIKANGEMLLSVIKAMPQPPDIKFDLPQPAPITVNPAPVNVTFEKGSIQNDISAPTTIAEGAVKTTIENIDARTTVEKGAVENHTTIAEGAVKAETHLAAPSVTIAEGAIKATTTIAKGAIQSETPLTINMPEAPDVVVNVEDEE